VSKMFDPRMIKIVPSLMALYEEVGAVKFIGSQTCNKGQHIDFESYENIKELYTKINYLLREMVR